MPSDERLVRRSFRRSSGPVKFPVSPVTSPPSPGHPGNRDRGWRSLFFSGWGRRRSFQCLGSGVLLAVVGVVFVSLFVRSTPSVSVPLGGASEDVNRPSMRRRLIDRFASPVTQAPSRSAEGSIADLKQLLLSIVGPPPQKDSRGMVAPGAGVNVTVLAVNYAYRQLAMNFVCNLRRLAIGDAYVILAMDRAMYNYAAKLGANVFYHSLQSKERGAVEDRDMPGGGPGEDDPVGNDNDEGYKFGSTGFVRTSWRKSMLVAEVLSLGYDVFFSDVDVVLYKDPHPVFAEFAEDFVVMSDKHILNISTNLNYNINSGFYFARSRPRSFVALRAVVKYATRSRRSEQKAFNHVLCGAFKDNVAGPGWRYGVDRCFYRILGGVTTHVLQSDWFPNGSDESVFTLPPSLVEQVFPEIRALHVNYVSGRNAKIDRINAIGQWYYNESAGSHIAQEACSTKPIGDKANMEPPPNDKDRYYRIVMERRSRTQVPLEVSDEDVTSEYDSGEGPNVEQLLIHQQRQESQKQNLRRWQENEQSQVKGAAARPGEIEGG